MVSSAQAAKDETSGFTESQIRQAAVKREDSALSTIAKVEEDTLSDDSDDGVAIVNQKHTEPPTTNCCTKPAAPKIISKMKVTKPSEKSKASPQPKPRKEKPPKNTSPLIPGDSRIFSTRVGEHFMDGQNILANFGKTYMRPWDDCIPSEELSLDNIPPFFRRLRNDQVGHVVEWINDRARVSITPANANQYWPYDLTGHGGAASKRDRWGKPYTGKTGTLLFYGGPALPTYIDMGLPLTWTSSGKAMCPDAGKSTGETGNKRKADQMMDEGIDSNGKRFCAWAKPETPEDVIQAFTSSLKALKEVHKTETDALRTEITVRDAAIEALKGEMEIALAEISNHDKVLRDKDMAIEEVETEGKKKKKVIDDLKLKIQNDMIATDLLQHENAEAQAQLNACDQTIKDKDTAIESLNHTIETSRHEIATRDKAIIDLQSTLQNEHTKTAKQEAKIKRQTTDLQTHIIKYSDEFRARQALEAKSKSNLKDLRKNLKDATTTLKLQETTIAEKEKVVRDTKKHVAQSDTKIQDLEARIKLMNEVMAKNEQNYSRREERVKHLETKIGFFGQAFDLCRELDEKEMGEVQDGENAGLKVMDVKDGDAKDSNVNGKDNDAGALSLAD